MTSQSPFQPSLKAKRDNHILEHTYRNGITIPKALHRLFMPTKTLNAVTQVTMRLVKDGYLARHPLWYRTVCFTLGKRCVRLFGVTRRKTVPRGEQVLPTDLGALLFCCLGETVHKRLLPDELLGLYPWFPQQYLGHPFCITNYDGQKRLTQIKVELAEYPNHIVTKHERQLHTFREIAPFRDLIEKDEFMIVTMTTTPERREALVEAFGNSPWYPAAYVYDHPDLCNLL